MRKLIALLVISLVLAATTTVALGEELSGLEIMTKVDENGYFPTAYSRAKMIIRARNREMVKEMEMWSEGDTRSGLVTFLNPGDRGSKYLKIEDELWMFFPHADDLVKISGHMLRQGMMGSDFSFSDALEADNLPELYTFTVVGEEEIVGRPTYVIEAEALPGAEVSYAKRKGWIDQERFVPLREELYAVSGKLLKVSTTKKVEYINGRYIPTEVVMEDQLKRNSSTTMILTHIEVGVEIPEGLLSLRSLMR